ncbi:hypothetical protein H4582DRAFT_1001570 [Lactarius indigo]|nr:hypothetical protein H4582DRAFT_1001570 [Lactarius indigo]
MSCIVKYTENDFSLLRSVIRELPPVHRETLGRLSRHLSLVASHSAQNGMTAKALASQFCYAVFRGNTIVEGYVYLKDSLMEDLIQNADTLFDEPLSPPALPSASLGTRASVISHPSFFGSTLFEGSHVMGPEFSPSARSSSTILPSYYSVDQHSTPPPRLPQDFPPSPLLSPWSTLTNEDIYPNRSRSYLRRTAPLAALSGRCHIRPRRHLHLRPTSSYPSTRPIHKHRSPTTRSIQQSAIQKRTSPPLQRVRNPG